MKTAVFAYRTDHSLHSGLHPDKMTLFKELSDRDIEPRLSLEAEAAFGQDSIATHELISETTVRSLGSVGIEDVSVIINRLDRSMKLDAVPALWQDSMPPVENNNTLRSLVFRKHRVQDELFEPLDLGMPTRLVESYLDLDIFLHDHPSDEYILKPTSGTFSKGIIRAWSNNVAQFFLDENLFGKTIIQPAYDFSLALPDTMRPYDSHSREAFDMFAKSTMTKELRMYGFYSPEATSVFPVGRAMQDGVDNWFFVDPDSVPEQLVQDTKNVLSRAARVSGSQAIYAALDIGYGRLGRNEPAYQQIELNGRMPYMIGSDKHKGISKILRSQFADQIAQSAHAKDAKI